MASWLTTTTMGNSPYINVEVYDDGCTRNGTNITVNYYLVLKAIQGQSWWGYGVNVSWGWNDRWGTWIQGDDIHIKSNGETQWGDTRINRSFTVDVGSYDSGAISASFCVYPNSGAWGNNAPVQFWYTAGTTNPEKGNITITPDKADSRNWFERLNIAWDSFRPGNGNNINCYEVWRQEKDGSNWRSRSCITEIWTSDTYGSYNWSGMPKYPMYYIRNKATGRYLDVNGGILANGQLVNTYPYNGGLGQRFSLENISDYYYYIHVDDSSAHILDVQGASTNNGALIQVYSWSGNTNTRFRFDHNSDGSYTIVPLHATDKCLDVNTTNNNLTLFTKNGGDNQKWILENANDAWRGITHRFNVVALGEHGGSSSTDGYVGDYTKNDRPVAPRNPVVSPSQVNIAQPITLRWTACVDNRLRANNTYEIEFERSRNGGAYSKVGSSVYSNSTSLTNYTGLNAYAQPGDLFRYRVRGYDYFDLVSDWSTYCSFEMRKSGLNYASNGAWKGHYAYVVVNGRWTMCEVYTVKNNQWTQCIMT